MSIIVSMYVIIPLLCVIGFRRNKESKLSLSRESSLEIRGVGMLLIVFAHAVDNNVNTTTYFFYASAILGVSSCFLLSGYGLKKAFKTKNNYLKGFLPNKILRLIIPYIILYVSYLVYSVFEGSFPALKTVGFELVTLQMDGILLWYLKIQILCYIIFYLAHRFAPKYSEVVIILGISFYIMIACFCKIGVTWYNTCMFFPLGVVVACYEKEIFTFLKKPIIILFSALITLGVFGVIYFYGRMNMAWLIDNLYMLSFNALLLGCVQYIKGSFVLKWIGKYSMEIYLLHLLLMKLNPFNFYSKNNGFTYLLVMLFSILLAIPVSKLSDCAMKITKK